VGDYPANWNAVQDVQKKAQLLAMQNDVKKRAAQYLLKKYRVKKSGYIFILVFESMGEIGRPGLPGHSSFASKLASPFGDGHGQNAYIISKQLLGCAVPIRYLILE
jgi:hypothetical protein